MCELLKKKVRKLGATYSSLLFLISEQVLKQRSRSLEWVLSEMIINKKTYICNCKKKPSTT